MKNKTLLLWSRTLTIAALLAPAVLFTGCVDSSEGPTVDETAPFISVWHIKSENLTVTLPLKKYYNYNFTVDWGDGSFPTAVLSYHDLNKTHTYERAGKYVVTIAGLLETWGVDRFYGENPTEFIEVTQLGKMGWLSLRRAFPGNSIKKFNAGKTDTSGVTSMSRMFEGAENITSLDLSAFNTSSLIDMSEMFSEMSSVTVLDLSHFDTSNVKYVENIFRDMPSLIQLNIMGWDLRALSEAHSPLMFVGTTTEDSKLKLICNPNIIAASIYGRTCDRQ